jgi:hypothetical protein
MNRRSAGDLPWYLLLVVPLLEAFGKGFMERLGERAADAAPDPLANLVRRLRRARRGANGQFEIEDASTGARFYITPDLPDAAFVAMREMDLTRPEHAGNVFVFDAETGQWRPIL